MERDIALLARGERVAGAAQGARALVGALVGAGLGGCMLYDGAPYRGVSGSDEIATCASAPRAPDASAATSIVSRPQQRSRALRLLSLHLHEGRR